MARVLFTFVPVANVVKATNTFAIPIVALANNVTFSGIIPTQHQDSGIKDFVNFFMSHPLRYALTNVPERFFLQHVCEFYYPLSFDGNAGTISGTVGDAHYKVHISVVTI